MTSEEPSGATGVRFVRQSTAHKRKGAAGFGTGNKYLGERKIALSCYLGRHAYADSTQSDIIPCHQYYPFNAVYNRSPFGNPKLLRLLTMMVVRWWKGGTKRHCPPSPPATHSFPCSSMVAYLAAFTTLAALAASIGNYW